MLVYCSKVAYTYIIQKKMNAGEINKLMCSGCTSSCCLMLPLNKWQKSLSSKGPFISFCSLDAPKSTKVVISPKGDIMEGYSVNLTCSTKANPPVERYAWFKVNAGQPWTKWSTQNLSFPSVRSHHSGKYYCTVWNQFGQEISPTVSLAVLCKYRRSADEELMCSQNRLRIKIQITLCTALPKYTAARPSEGLLLPASVCWVWRKN